MPLAKDIRDKLLSTFRAELKEHIQTITNGLLNLEQGRFASDEERKAALDNVFRAAHSLKGAARTMGATAIEQIAHALENVLDGLRKEKIGLDSKMVSACCQALDAIQTVQTAYEAGETTPPMEALQALAVLQPFSVTPQTSTPAKQPAPTPAEQPSPQANETSEAKAVSDEDEEKASQEDSLPSERLKHKTPGDETIRINVGKVDDLAASLSELVQTKIRIHQGLTEMLQLLDLIESWQKEWAAGQGAINRLNRQEKSGTLPWQLRPVESYSSEGSSAQMAFVDPNSFAFYPWSKGSSPASSQPAPARFKHNGSEQNRLGKDFSQMLSFVNSGYERLRKMSLLVEGLIRETANNTASLELAVGKLDQDIKQLRLLPFNSLEMVMVLTVRDLAAKAGKEVALKINGGETELDKHVLEQIKDPLIHLLRNAIDHGIEPPEERLAKGKSRQGNIVINVNQMGEEIILQVEDDGAGLNIPAIRKSLKSERRANVQNLSDAEVIDSIFTLGVTTRARVTNVSGRGVGLDIVRNNVKELRGHVRVETEPGKRTCFTIHLPTSLTGLRSLLVKVSGQLFAIPLNSIELLLSRTDRDVISLEGRQNIIYSDEPIHIVQLAELLGLPVEKNSSKGAAFPILILSFSDQRLAVRVDEIVNEQEVVIKSLGKQLKRVSGIAGASVLGDGGVVLVLNVIDLLKLAQHNQLGGSYAAPEFESEPEFPSQPGRILVVDDSITTRTLEKNILEAAGYQVQVAVDGQEALEFLNSGEEVDLIISDIIMPRVDGFELTRQIKSQERFASLPIILVTSLNSSRDKERGIVAGADAYIVKSQFDQNALLEAIEQFL